MHALAPCLAFQGKTRRLRIFRLSAPVSWERAAAGASAAIEIAKLATPAALAKGRYAMLDYAANPPDKPAGKSSRRNRFSPSEGILCAALERLISRGALALRLPSGRERRFGEDGASLVGVALEDANAVRRLMANAELALGELYTDGLLVIDGDDIDGLLALILQNLREHGFRTRAAPAGIRLAEVPRREINGKRRALRNVAHHYDISNEFYRLFLDEDLQYSCAYFETGAETLEQAQEAKKELIAAKLCLRPGLSILDIGCGWGGLALHLARTRGVNVRGITLSQAQLPVARMRAQAQGLAAQTEFALEDYRETNGAFDRIVSVGMFEHVGRGHYDEFFRQIAALLAEDGVALLHTIGRADGPGATSPWIDRYIFPGGHIPALSEIMPAIERAGLYVTDIEVWRLHYAFTLRAWRERFEAHLNDVRAMFDESFCRMWRFYLAASEAAFRYGGHEVFQIQLARRQDAVPRTRRYLERTG
ncbi:MAG: cyclopropane-fatty-acyl-phospholipid synthase family protein [Hyphomonadaceae bacterium]|nr:cyclopropane-fatty-acyl-phospholipid synthase family protein [Hyphomonadaceae bacterium]